MTPTPPCKRRPKTGIPRRCPLWPETAAALKDWLAARAEPRKPEHAGLNGHRNFYTLRHVTQTIGDEARDFVAVLPGVDFGRATG